MTIITPNCTPVVGCEKNATVGGFLWLGEHQHCERQPLPAPVCSLGWPSLDLVTICGLQGLHLFVGTRQEEWYVPLGTMFHHKASRCLCKVPRTLRGHEKKKKKAVPLFSLKLSFQQDDWWKSHRDLVKQRVPWAYGVCCFCSEESTNYDLGWSLLSVLVAWQNLEVQGKSQRILPNLHFEAVIIMMRYATNWTL